ncbi:MAG TPA: hypothetical protein ENG66_05510 [Thermococcus sp.]|nr:hypothetical protein [Thermococcus sp.]
MWDGVRVTRDLVRKWGKFAFDVCGVGRSKMFQVSRNIFITHTHNDHLPLREALSKEAKIFVASPLLPRIQRLYPHLTIEEYTDYLQTEHTFIANGRVTKAVTFGYFIHSLVLIPESDHAEKILEEYRSRYTLVFAFKQPRNHFGELFNNHRRDIFLLDNTVWKPYAPNIIPKIIPAEIDRNSKYLIIPRRPLKL